MKEGQRGRKPAVGWLGDRVIVLVVLVVVVETVVFGRRRQKPRTHGVARRNIFRRPRGDGCREPDCEGHIDVALGPEVCPAVCCDRVL